MKSREIQRVMHEVKIRTLTVARIENVTPSLKRITLAGPDLAGFKSLSPDDHVKVFFPYPGEDTPVVPTLGPEGMRLEPGSRPPIMRDYTPRRYDEAAQELQIEFVIHGDGAGSRWAEHARLGQRLTIGGPRGSTIVPFAFDWYLMIGDESAIPSIARRAEELPKGATSIAMIEVEEERHETPIAASKTVWIHRHSNPAGTANGFMKALETLELPEGDGFVWVAAEKAAAMQIKEYLLSTEKVRPEFIKATGYWTKDK
jgi:NADPH-dependent ferric siderophore reductase